MKALNKVIGGIGIITGDCKKLGCSFKHKLETNSQAIRTLCQIVDDGAKALELA